MEELTRGGYSHQATMKDLPRDEQNQKANENFKLHFLEHYGKNCNS